MAVLGYKLKKMSPEIKRYLGQITLLTIKAGAVVSLLEKLNKFTEDLGTTTESGDICTEEGQMLYAEIKAILADPAVSDLKELVKTLE